MSRVKGGVSYDELSDLLRRVDEGDADAMREAQQLSATLSKRANVRLSALKEAGYEQSAAYRYTQGMLREYTGREKFSESKQLSAGDLEQNLLIVNEFLNQEGRQTTVSGVREVYSKRAIESLEEAGIVQIDDEKKERELAKFLRSDTWEAVSSVFGHGNSGGYITRAAEAIERGATVSGLRQIYKDFQQREDEDWSAIDVVEKWIRV